MCISLAILFFILYEIGLTLFYNWVKKDSVEMATWVILGSKILKFIFAVAIIVLVHFFTDEPIVRFTFVMLGILIVTIIYETGYFIFSGKKNRKLNEK